MAERTDSRTWINRAVFVLAAFVLIVIDLVPLDMRPSAFAMPDFLLLVTLVWVARQPSYAPAIVIAVLFLMADFMFMRPPGLWAALVLLLTETIRSQHRDFRSMPLLVEWGSIAAGIVAITLANRIVLAVVMAPQAPLGLTLIEMIATIAVYPLVVVIAHFAFGVARTAPGEVGKKGHLL